MMTRFLFCSVVSLLLSLSFGFTVSAKSQNESLLAVENGNKLILQNRNDFLGYACRGTGYNFLGKYDLAEHDFLKAIELKPNEGGLYSQLASVYYQTGRYDDSLVSIRKAISLGQTKEAMFNAELASLNSAAHHSECLERSEEIIRKYPRDGAAYFYKAMSKMQIGTASSEEILADLAKARLLSPNDQAIEQEYLKAKVKLPDQRRLP
ncbi:MAG: hypothetical protein IPP97_23530 [Candidatus Obscuribacter sp.]|jgi:tetratricopeptide (TPR) repeat protein|nr:hypothetical protein [Candidatus Obscuribacter sp.]